MNLWGDCAQSYSVHVHHSCEPHPLFSSIVSYTGNAVVTKLRVLGNQKAIAREHILLVKQHCTIDL